MKILQDNFLLACISGLLFVLGWPMIGFPILLFFTFIPLLWIEFNYRKKSISETHFKRVLGYSYITFFIFNIFTTYWLWNASVGGMLFAVLVNSLLMALTFSSYHWVTIKAGKLYGTIAFICFWISFEHLHLNWELSWPWLNLGNGFAEYHQLIQWYEYTGAFGGTLWVLIVNFMLFSVLKLYSILKDKSKLIQQMVLPIFIILIPIAYSFWMYESYENKGEEVEVLLVQPNLDPYTEKFNLTAQEQAQQLQNLIKKNKDTFIHLVVTPETSMTSDGRFNVGVLNTNRIVKKWQDFARNYPNTNFLLGATTYKNYFNSEEKTISARQTNDPTVFYDVFNSALQINHLKNDTDFYHKAKLVVGVENTPFKSLIEPLLGDVILNMGGTTGKLGISTERKAFTNSLNTITVAPIICYESVYGEYAANYIKNKKANLLAVITNDAWWGNTAGHKQHLLFSKLRAIESRRDLVRSANTGISAFINQRGDIISSLDYGLEGTLKGTAQLNTEETTYVSYGNLIARIGLILSGILISYTLAQRLLTGKKP